MATTTHTSQCRVCGVTVEWTTAEWEPADTEAPFDTGGHYVCDAHAGPGGECICDEFTR